MVDRCNAQDKTIIEHVQIIDLENDAHLPKGRCIEGMLAGNDNWRSPEAHFKGELNKPTDMFSFAIVVSNPILWGNGALMGIISVSMQFLDL